MPLVLAPRGPLGRVRVPFGAGGFAGFGFGGGQSAEDIFAQFDQMFSEAGRRQRAPRGPPRGQDVQAQVSLDFLQAVRGLHADEPSPNRTLPLPLPLPLTLTLILALSLTLALSLCLPR